ncbi:UDP-N-acetylmuramate dehydrogenase [Gracilimonas sp.]|uniref:UDP-N-acetylmuramate dehydrogenase n=1 Tax=Gracilimonas sp. TaxID=1974203 RepID=UPI0028728BAF|nr:UDP-N-acetylmuramate dehydrogenase [Gracilimonas sp.]
MSNLPAIHEYFDLTDFNTMGISVEARYFASVENVEQLQALLKDPQFKEVPKMMLGGGSNVLFVDDYEGLIIHLENSEYRVDKETENEVVITVGAGKNWHELVLECVEKEWSGIENLSLIPGSMGAAPIQNIGAYGVELEEVFVKLRAVDIVTGEIRVFNKEECLFGYRDSIFKKELKGKYIITDVTLRLNKNGEVNTSYRALSEKLDEKGITNPTIKQVSDAVTEIRQSKLPDPTEIGNTGSFFKNPIIDKVDFTKLQKKFPEIPHYPSGNRIKIPAAWLIDQCGWKGKRVGDAGVHKMQALVIVNYGGATGQDIWELAKKIQQSVTEHFGITLRPEVNVVGNV